MGDSGGPSESQVGDDPATFDDEGVGYGNINTTTEQALSDDPTIDSDFTASDAAEARANIQNQQETINIPSITTSNIAPGVFQDQRTKDMLADTTGATAPISKVATDTIVDRSPLGFAKTMLSNLGSLRESYNNPIYQAAVEKADRGQAEKSDLQKIQEALDAETVAENLDRPAFPVISEFALGARTPGTRTTATGTFDPEAENLMDSTFLDTTPYKEGTAVADIKLRDAPFDENLNLFGLQIPNLAGRALNFGAEKLNDRLFDAIVKKGGQALRDNEGRIIGAMDPTNSFLMEGMPGLDAKGQMRGQMQEEQGGGEQTQRRVAPKAPTDPCPDGYQLIDGKCTPVETDDKGTGFITFPPDRDPPFRTGPFTPRTIATNPIEVRPMVPLTFGLSNIFRR